MKDKDSNNLKSQSYENTHSVCFYGKRLTCLPLKAGKRYPKNFGRGGPILKKQP
jgi:hypothetical protein